MEGEPLARSEEVRQAVRKLLRHGGYRCRVPGCRSSASGTVKAADEHGMFLPEDGFSEFAHVRLEFNTFRMCGGDLRF